MTGSTGTYAFNPATSDLVLVALSRIGIRGAQITTQHMMTAYQESNLLLVDWANKQPNLWTEDRQSVALTAGTAVYVCPANTVTTLIASISITSGSTITDYLLTPITGQDYEAYPVKTTTGRPTVYYFERLEIPQITLWPVPDTVSTYTLNYRRCRQIQDASVKGGATLDTPYRFFDAFTSDLAHRLSRHWAPALEMVRAKDAAESWAAASYEDQEDADYSIVPIMEGYFR